MQEINRLFSNIKIVLVATTHPGNIGSAARAMKTMGFEQLVLVNPEKFPHSEATALASGADDILAKAQVVTSLKHAIADCRFVVATSARSRTLPWPMLTPPQAATQLLDESRQAPVAIVFGQEKAGLSNEQLQLCHAHVRIDTHPTFGVLNLAAAVQVLTYQVRTQAVNAVPPSHQDSDYASMADIERLFTHLEETITDIGFIQDDKPNIIMARLRRLFARTRLEYTEVQMLRGILTFMQKAQHGSE